MVATISLASCGEITWTFSVALEGICSDGLEGYCGLKASLFVAFLLSFSTFHIILAITPEVKKSVGAVVLPTLLRTLTPLILARILF